MNDTEGTRQNYPVTLGEGVPFGLQKSGGGDCLLKTQDSAKFNNEVLSLTSAQCRKMKLIGEG